MGEELKVISDFIYKQYSKREDCRIISFKPYYIFSRLIDKILNIKKRNYFIIKLITSNNNVKVLLAIEKKGHDKSGPEHKTLNKHWKNHYRKNQRYKIPMPFGWIPEHKILITEKSKGILLSKILMLFLVPGINLFAKNYIYKKIALSVDWLIDFQKYTVKNKPFNFLNLYNVTQEIIKKLSEEWKRIAKSIFKQIEFQKISILKVPQVDWHGDFLHRNILIKGNIVTVFDWEGHWKFDLLHPLYEIYRFIFNLFLISRRPIYKFKKIQKIASWTFQYYRNHTFFNIDYESYKTIYYLFLIDVIYNYDKQIVGFSIPKNEKHTRLIRKILCTNFMDIFMKGKMVKKHQLHKDSKEELEDDKKTRII